MVKGSRNDQRRIMKVRLLVTLVPLFPQRATSIHLDPLRPLRPLREAISGNQLRQRAYATTVTSISMFNASRQMSVSR